MNQYYINNGGESIGPFPAEQLAEHGLTLTSLVWSRGMASWQRANEVAELAQFLPSAPPEVPTAPISVPPAPPAAPVASPPQQYDSQATTPIRPQSKPIPRAIPHPTPQPMTQFSYADEEHLPLTTSQKVFRAFEFFPVVLTMLFGIGMFLGSLLVYMGYNVSNDIHTTVSSSKIHTSFALLLISTMLITLISIISLVKLIKGRGYGFITIGLFLVCSIYVVVAKFRGISTLFSKAARSYHDFHEIRDFYNNIVKGLVIFGLISLVIAIFAAIPIEKLGSGRRYKALYKETTRFDYILIGLFFAVIILLHYFSPIFEFLIR